MTGMRTRNEYIHLLRSQEAVLRQDYGIRSLRLFGSVAREQQTEQSDIDVCVEMDPKPFVRLHVKDYLGFTENSGGLCSTQREWVFLP